MFGVRIDAGTEFKSCILLVKLFFFFKQLSRTVVLKF